MSIQGSYSAIWSLPPTHAKWHSDPRPTAISQSIRLFHQFHGLDTELDLPRITVVFFGAFATGAVCQQETFTLPDTWIRLPFGDLRMLQLLRIVIPNLPCLFPNFHLEYPSVLSWLYFQTYVKGHGQRNIRRNYRLVAIKAVYQMIVVGPLKF